MTLKPAAAGPTHTLTGVVLDHNTGSGLAGAHVFLIDSTHGTVTDENGAFTIAGLSAGVYQLGVSMLGYLPCSFTIDVPAVSEKILEIQLETQVYELDPVTVTAKRNRRWHKQLEKFTLQVIGDSDNASYTRILNPEVLNFTRQKNVLIAEASDALVIENLALGYRIHYTLVHCAIENDLPQFKGIARFEELEPRNRRQRRQWRKNRKYAYNGSLKHLLHTLATATDMRDVEREGFQLARVSEFPKTIQSYEQILRQSRDTIDDLVKRSPAEEENVLLVKDYLLISYYGELESERYVRHMLGQSREPGIQLSSIKVKPDSTTFNDKGFLYDTYSVVRYGYMGWERMADMLPLNYEPAGK